MLIASVIYSLAVANSSDFSNAADQLVTVSCHTDTGQSAGSVSPNVQFRLGLTLMDDPYLFLLFMLLFLLDGLYEARNRDSGE